MNTRFSSYRAPRAPRPRWHAFTFVALLLTFLSFASNFAHAQTISTVAGTGIPGYNGDNQQATTAQLNNPTYIAFDGAGNLYIADYTHNRIRKVDSNGVISTVAGIGIAGYNGDNQQATAARLNMPSDVAFDSAGNLYIADTNNARIRKVDSNGVISTVAGIGIAGYDGDNRPATTVQLNNPIGIAFDSAGNLYIADTGNSRIRKVDGNGIISTVVGTGIAGYNGDNRQATTAQIGSPYDVAFDSAGNFYISDYGSHRVRKVEGNGIISTFAGTGIAGYNGDNRQAATAQLNSPTSVAFDRAGNIYIADFFNNRIRKVDGNGVTSTIAGTGVAGYNGDSQQATTAQLNRPAGVVFDRIGTLHITEFNGSRVRKVSNPAPTIASFNPTRGPVGSPVVINGTGFIGATAVNFNGVAATSYVVGSDTQITATVPSGNTTGKISVTTPNGTATSTDSFTITETPSLVVTTTADDSIDTDGVTSLREAIDFANSDANASAITFDATTFGAARQTITVVGNLPAIITNTAITAPSAGVVVRTATSKTTIFTINSGTVTLSGLTIQVNSGSSNDSNGVLNNGGNLTVEGCTLTGSDTGIFGFGTATVRNCTLTGNDSAILTFGTLTVTSSTVSGNRIGINGGPKATVSVSNSIVSGNSGRDTFDGITDGGFNLIGGDAKLGALADNGGPTQTFALLAGSPAIDAGNSALTSDQRGLPRPARGADDIGAYEEQNAQPIVSGFSKTLLEDTTLTFSASDFSSAYSDAENDALQSVRVDALPTGGTLTLSGIAVTTNQIIAVADLGKLTFAPASNFNGATSFDFNANDTFGFAAKSARLTLNVTAVNDAPSFTVGANQTSSEDAGSQLVTGFATNISAGAGNESTQTLTFVVTNDNNALFSAQPTINAAGDLSYRAKDDANGTATVTVSLKDDGGVLNNGADTSATQTFTITVTAVNDAPIALADNYTTDDNVTLTVSAANGVLANDGDIDSANLTAVLDQTTSRGTLTLGKDGSFSYVPERGATYTTSFSYHANDGALDSKSVNVTIGVNVTPQNIDFGVSITPKAPSTLSVLTATPVILNATGVSYSYAWSVNGTVKQDGPSNSFDLSVVGNGDKGDRVSVVVTATRGIDGGTATNFVDVQNSAPFAFSQSGAAKADVPTSFTLRGADLDNEVLTFKRVGGPNNGTAIITNNVDGSATLTYTGRADFGGVEAIRFVSVDESGRPSTPATLSIAVTRAATTTPQPNRAPVANNVTASTRSGVLVKIPLSGSDPDGDALTFKRVGGPTNGTGEIARDSDGLFKMFYTPRAGFVGNEVIRFVALDTAGKPSAVATMTINVSGTSAPSAGNS